MRLLLAAYFYPPCRDTGAHRPAAMAKYLRRLGHDVTVLTTSAYGRRDDDAELQVERTADAQLWRARMHGRDRIDALYDAPTYSGSFHPLSRIVVPEPLALAWTPFARARARRLHRDRRFDCVITTSPPESVHRIGADLQRRSAAWVADLRDGWTFEPLRPRFPTALQRRLDARLERRLLGHADAVVCVSEIAAEDLRARGVADPLLVRNGADPELLEAAPGDAAELLDPDRVSLVYTGRFGSSGRDPRGLVAGLERLAAEHPEDAGRLELVVAGPLTDAERNLFSADVSPARIVIAGPLPREHALGLQHAADALVLIAHPVRTQLANFKLYEYLSAGPPILALAGGTEAGRIAAAAGVPVADAADAATVAELLGAAARRALPAPDPQARAAYSYPAPAERMAAAAERAIAAHAPPGSPVSLRRDG